MAIHIYVKIVLHNKLLNQKIQELIFLRGLAFLRSLNKTNELIGYLKTN